MITRRQARLLALTSGDSLGGAEDGRSNPAPTASTAAPQPQQPPPQTVSLRRAGRQPSASTVGVKRTRSAGAEDDKRADDNTTTAVVDVSAILSQPIWRPRLVLSALTSAVMRHWQDECSLAGAFTYRRPPASNQLSAVTMMNHASSAAPLSAAPGPRLAAAQLRAAWRGAVRDSTTMQYTRPQAHVRYADRLGGSSASTATSQQQQQQRTLSLKGSAASAESADPTDTRYWTRRRYVCEKQQRMQAHQSRLSQEVNHYAYVKAHEGRMRLLFGSDGGDAEASLSSSAGLTDAEREKAYLQHLDPSRSAKEANVLHVIQAIDSQMQAQFRRVYHASTENNATTNSSNSISSLSEPSEGVIAAQRRLQVVSALAAEATRHVKNFSRLMPYQQEGVRWLLQLNFIERMNGILADDMGLGKTAQTVLYLSCYRALMEQLLEERLEVLLQFVRATPAEQLKAPLPPDVTSFMWAINPESRTLLFPGVAPELAPVVETIRTLKEVKRWLWQLEEEDVAEESADDDDYSNNKRGHTRHSSHNHNNMSSSSSQEAAPSSRVVLKKKRGRPSKADLAARAELASAAAASSAASASAGYYRGGIHSTHDALEAALCLRNCSPRMNAALQRPQRMGPILIVAPLSTLPHWRHEFDHFGVADMYTIYVLNGARTERDDAVRAFMHHYELRKEYHTWRNVKDEEDHITNVGRRHSRSGKTEGGAAQRQSLLARTPVLLIPHDLLVRPLTGPQRHIPHVSWHVVVIDEAQRIKNSSGSLFNRMCGLASVSRLVLTGTPLQNNIVELFALLQFLAPHTFHRKQHRGMLEQLDEALTEASRSNALEDRELHILLCRRVHQLLAPFILRRDKSVIRSMLPAKKDFAIVCPLLPFQASRIDEVHEKHRQGRLSGNPNIQVRKILLHPYTLLPYFYVDEDVVRTSGKLLVLDFMMRFLQRTNHKFLVFCSWTMVLDVVETLCSWRRIPFVRLDGRTSVEQRELNIRSFNNDGAAAEDGGEGVSVSPTTTGGGSSPCCFLISKVAGGVGLNLQAADTVFLLDVDYNPQRDNQALSRVYRVGQKKEVRIFRLLIDHESERDVVAIHQAKENLDKAVVQAGKYDLHSSAKEREAELQKLFARDDGSAMTTSMSPSSPGSPLFPFGPGEVEQPASPTVIDVPALAMPPEEVRNIGRDDDDTGDGGSSNSRRTRRVRFAAEVVDATGGDSSSLTEALAAAPADKPAEGHVPAGAYILGMKDRLRDVLIRAAGEHEVLTTMMQEQEVSMRQEMKERRAAGL